MNVLNKVYAQLILQGTGFVNFSAWDLEQTNCLIEHIQSIKVERDKNKTKNNDKDKQRQSQSKKLETIEIVSDDEDEHNIFDV